MLGIALLVVAALDFNAAANEMEQAVIEGDDATLLRLSDQFRDALDSDPADRDVRLPYAVAYAGSEKCGMLITGIDKTLNLRDLKSME